MKIRTIVAAGSILVAGLSGPALAANMCQAPPLSCATTMPVGGYCQCVSQGQTASGTVVSSTDAHTPSNSTAGGCGTQPNAAGCK